MNVMKKGQRIFVAHVEDRPGVLNRVASLFRRRGWNNDSVTVGRSEEPGVSRMTVVLEADEDMGRRVVANLEKLIDVLRVEELGPHVERELALIKVRADPSTRESVLRTCEHFRARVVDVGPEALTIEMTGTTHDVDGFVDVLRPLHIVEMVRTGVVAMTRNERSDTWQKSSTTPTRAAS
jgi:acetolactate synthase I/III small subunit